MSPRTYLLALGAFAVGTSGYIVSGVLPEVSRDLDVSVATAGQLGTVFAIAYAIASPLLAAFTGRWERRRLLVIALAVSA
ncbi:MAG TPA: MFS transporter, partial [Gemmatimonadaceae bacterium]|nr:MFS transporter [Gemmatimonadaceae bacterium]